ASMCMTREGTMTDIAISADKLARYLQVAANQRKRALAKAIQLYGADHGVVVEQSAEVAELELVIGQLAAVGGVEAVEIRGFPPEAVRVETGPISFGDD